jgi:hypothetical protein
MSVKRTSRRKGSGTMTRWVDLQMPVLGGGRGHGRRREGRGRILRGRATREAVWLLSGRLCVVSCSGQHACTLPSRRVSRQRPRRAARVLPGTARGRGASSEKRIVLRRRQPRRAQPDGRRGKLKMRERKPIEDGTGHATAATGALMNPCFDAMKKHVGRRNADSSPNDHHLVSESVTATASLSGLWTSYVPRWGVSFEMDSAPVPSPSTIVPDLPNFPPLPQDKPAEPNGDHDAEAEAMNEDGYQGKVDQEADEPFGESSDDEPVVPLLLGRERRANAGARSVHALI